MFYLKNNLFSFATSELSQDAFICWLLSYATESSDNQPRLKQCAIDFIRKFTNNEINENIVVDCIHRQDSNIDVWFEVNGKYAIIIEDKTGTQQHDNQLKRYKEIVEQKGVNRADIEKFDKIYGVYFKTGFQSDLREVADAEYCYIAREDILEIMSAYQDVQNDIFRDFYNYYLEYDKYAKLYLELPIMDWDHSNYYAFYENLRRSIKEKYADIFDSNYLYVPNRSGGFYGMWIMKPDSVFLVQNIPCEIYLQVESQANALKIALKVSMYNIEGFNVNSIRSAIRELLVYRKDKQGNWVKNAGEYDMRTLNCGFEKPTKFSPGKTMTLGIYRKKIEGVSNSREVLMESIEAYKGYRQQLLDDGFVKYAEDK